MFPLSIIFIFPKLQWIGGGGWTLAYMCQVSAKRDNFHMLITQSYLNVKIIKITKKTVNTLYPERKRSFPKNKF